MGRRCWGPEETDGQKSEASYQPIIKVISYQSFQADISSSQFSFQFFLKNYIPLQLFLPFFFFTFLALVVLPGLYSLFIFPIFLVIWFFRSQFLIAPMRVCWFRGKDPGIFVFQVPIFLIPNFPSS